MAAWLKNYSSPLDYFLSKALILFSYLKQTILPRRGSPASPGWNGLWRSLSPSPRRGRVTWSSWHRNVSRWVWTVSRQGHSWISLGSLFQRPVTLRVKKFLPTFRRDFLCFSLWQSLPMLSLGTTETSEINFLRCTGTHRFNTRGSPRLF